MFFSNLILNPQLILYPDVKKQTTQGTTCNVHVGTNKMNAMNNNNKFSQSHPQSKT